MRIVCISDTHGYFPPIPECDLLVHAGDLTNMGTKAQVEEGMAWLGSLKADKVVFVPGNHDFYCHKQQAEAQAMADTFKVDMLIDKELVYNGFMVYGSPWQPWFHDWAFSAPRDAIEGSEFLQEKWARIPWDTDILVTHCPPYETGDLVGGARNPANDGRRIGCRALQARVGTLSSLELHVFGHCHSGYGVYQRPNRVAVNASTCNEQYQPANPPILVHL